MLGKAVVGIKIRAIGSPARRSTCVGARASESMASQQTDGAWPMDFHSRQWTRALGAYPTNKALNIRGIDLLTCSWPRYRFMLTFRSAELYDEDQV